MEGWKRDLTEEGIEPNPGPRYVTKNISSIASLPRWERILIDIKKEHRQRPITAIFLQETALRKTAEHREKAAAHGFELFAVPLCGGNTDGIWTGSRQSRPYTRGGTAILIPKEKIELLPGETHHDAAERMRRSTKRLRDGRGISIQAIIDGRALRLASVYAFPGSEANKRPDFWISTTCAAS